MSWLPKLHREFRVSGDPDKLSHDLVSELRHHGVTVQSHYPGSRIIGSVLRPMSMSGGQQLRVDFRPVAKGEVEAVVESRFRFPGVDFTHENEKNVAIVEDLLHRLAGTPHAAVMASAMQARAQGVAAA
jgi:hypothetical protein